MRQTVQTTVYTLDEFASDYWDLSRLALDEPGSDGFRRSWIMFMPQGTFAHPDYGTLDFSRKALGEYKRNFDARVLKIDVALDVNHNRAEAPGWVERMELGENIGRAPGLWGLVRWTPLGEKLLAEQTFRYFSPDLQPYTDERSGTRYEKVVRGGGLVNRPFLKDMDAVALGEGLSELSQWLRMEGAPMEGAPQGGVRVKRGQGQTDLLGLAELEDEDDEPFVFAEDDDTEFDDEAEDAESFADGEGAGDGRDTNESEAYADDGTQDDNPDDEDVADGGDDEEEELPPPTAPAKRKRGAKGAAGGKRMGDKGMSAAMKAGVKAGVKCAEPSGRAMTLAEQRAVLAELAELKAERQKADVRDQVERWQRAVGKGKALSRVFAHGYIRLMEQAASTPDGAIRLSEGDTTAAVNKVIELALTRGVVDTSVKGTSFDMEDPDKQMAGMRLSDAEKSERRLRGVAVELAEKAGKEWGSLTGNERGTYLLAAEKRVTRPVKR